jgi:hypothetical protein
VREDKADADIVVICTSVDLRRLIEIRKPAFRVRYDIDVLPDLQRLLDGRALSLARSSNAKVLVGQSRMAL